MNEWQAGDMPGIIEVIRKWRKSILLLILLATASATVMAFLLPKMFSSTAVVFPVNSLLSDKSHLFNPNIQQLYSEYGGSEDLDHLFAIANSSTVLGYVSDSFHLAQHYKITGNEEKAKASAIKKLKKNTDIIKSENGELRIEVWDEDNVLALAITNAILYKIESLSREIMLQSNNNALNVLRKKLLRDSSIHNNTGSGISVNKELKELEISLEATPPVFLLLERPALSFEPGKPKTWMIIAGTFILSTFFAIILVLVLERSNIYND